MAILKRSKKSILGLETQLRNIETNVSNIGSNISDEITRAKNAEDVLRTATNNNTNAINIINADITTTGSMDKKIADAISTLATAADTYTKTEVDALNAEKLDADLVLSVVSVGNKLATEAELATKANINDVYTRTQLDISLAAKADQTTTYTKAECDTALALKADQSTTYTKTEIDSLVSPKANSADVYTKIETDTLFLTKLNTSDTVTTVTDVNKIVTQNELAAKANVSDVYTKTEVDSALSLVLVDSDTVTAVTDRNKIITETELSLKANSADVYTRTQLDTALSGKADISVVGKVGPSLKLIDETNIADGKVLAYNATTGKLEYVSVDNSDTTTIDDDSIVLDKTWSSTKISHELTLKADQTNTYTKAEVDAIAVASASGIKYVVEDTDALNELTDITTGELAVNQLDRKVYKYDGESWNEFYALDAIHNHDDRYYTESEIDAALNLKADVGLSYTKTENDVLLAAKADASDIGKLGPSLITIDETNIADGKVLAYNSSTSQLEYVTQDGSNILDDTESSLTSTYSSTKIDTELAAKADSATTYTKTEIDAINTLKVNVSDVKSAITSSNKIITEAEALLKADVANTYTKGEVDNFINAKVNTSDVLTAITADNKVVTESDIAGLADASSVYTKVETDTLLASKANAVDHYTKAQVDTMMTSVLVDSDVVTAVTAENKIATETELAAKADIATTYTKTETDALVTPKFDNTNVLTAVTAENKIVTEAELAHKVNVSDVKSTIATDNKIVTESDLTNAIAASEARSANTPTIVVDRPTMSIASSSGLDYVFTFPLSKTPHGSVAINDEITIYDFEENGDASIFEGVTLFADKYATISVTLNDTSEESKYDGKTVKVCYLTVE